MIHFGMNHVLETFEKDCLATFIGTRAGFAEGMNLSGNWRIEEEVKAAIETSNLNTMLNAININLFALANDIENDYFFTNDIEHIHFGV